MEPLQILQKKLIQLMALVKELQAQVQELKTENTTLTQKNADLLFELDTLKAVMVSNQEALAEEKELAKSALNEIIKNIDSLVSNQDHL
jgi:regulator of replication initiation timing